MSIEWPLQKSHFAALHCTVIHFVSISAKFGICTRRASERDTCLSWNTHLGHLNAYFSFNKCPLQTHDDANVKFLSLIGTDYSVSETALLAGIPSIRYFLPWIPTKSHCATWVGTSGRTFCRGYRRKVITLPESALLAELSSETVHSALVTEVTLQLLEGIATKECLTAFAAVLGVVINRITEQLLHGRSCLSQLLNKQVNNRIISNKFNF